MDEKTASTEDGQKVKLDGQGFSHEEDGRVLDHWFLTASRAIYFGLCRRGILAEEIGVEKNLMG